jgi:hypothetical protein
VHSLRNLSDVGTKLEGKRAPIVELPLLYDRRPVTFRETKRPRLHRFPERSRGRRLFAPRANHLP